MAEKCKRRKRECNDLGLLSELNLEWLLKGASLLCFLKEPVFSFSFPQALSLFNSNLNTDLFSQHFSHTQYACVCGCLCACVCVRPWVGVVFHCKPPMAEGKALYRCTIIRINSMITIIIIKTVQLSSRWYLCARKSPYALHRVSQTFP